MRGNDRNRPAILDRGSHAGALVIRAAFAVFVGDFLEVLEGGVFVVHVHESSNAEAEGLAEGWVVAEVGVIVGVYEAGEEGVAGFGDYGSWGI